MPCLTKGSKQTKVGLLSSSATRVLSLTVSLTTILFSLKKKNAVVLAHAPKSFLQALFPALPQSTRAPPCSAHLCFEDAVTFSALLSERLFSIFPPRLFKSCSEFQMTLALKDYSSDWGNWLAYSTIWKLSFHFSNFNIFAATVLYLKLCLIWIKIIG